MCAVVPPEVECHLAILIELPGIGRFEVTPFWR
jgi:hypothetical protein